MYIRMYVRVRAINKLRHQADELVCRSPFFAYFRVLVTTFASSIFLFPSSCVVSVFKKHVVFI